MFLLLGCLTSQTEYDALLARAQDADQDGMAALAYGGTDCDDTDPLVNPVASEVCDGVDNDCNGLVDDAPRDPLTWFLDGDGDGFGDDGRTAQGCEAPAAHVGVGGDCDDGDSLIRPDGYEVCDGVDNDCDGLVDDADDSVDLSTGEAWYPDGDGDGYGDGTTDGVRACVAPTGLLLDFGDCDDGDPNINPNATEICKDGLDNDCSGDAPECALRGTYSLENADLIFEETSLKGTTTDQDNDGLLELVVGVPDADNGGRSNSGAVVLLEQPYSSELSDAIWRFEGRKSNDGLGFAVAGNNDLNSDGYEDLAVAAPGSAEVYLFFGSSSGHSDQPDIEISGSTDWAFGLGIQSTAAGELAISSPGVEEDPAGSKVYFWSEAPPNGPAESTADWSIWQPDSFFMGYFFTVGMGDLNGDGNTDLFAAAADIDEGYLNYGPLEGGELMATDSDSIIEDGVVSAAFGDMNGDGYEELLLGNMLDSTNGDSAGAAFIFQGGAAELSASLAYTQAKAGIYGEAGEQLGLVTIGDVDANGLEDTVLASVNGTGASLFYGPVTSDRDSEDAAAHITGYESGLCFWPLALSDIDQDGSADLIVSCAESSFGLQVLLGTPM